MTGVDAIPRVLRGQRKRSVNSTPTTIALPPRFRRGATLGRGGQKEVVFAFDTLLERDVAISIYHRDREGSLDSWLREARALARVCSHAGIVSIYEILIAPDALFIVSEYVNGEDLGTRLRKAGRLNWQECREIAAQLLSALAHVHAHGVIHRDIKPSNILLTQSREVRLGDFGLARALDGRSQSGSVLVGTPEYMSPEQISGAPIRSATDLYSFGCLLFRMLEGRSPFENHPRGVLYGHLNATPPKLTLDGTDVPIAVATLLGRLLEKDPSLRPDVAAATQFFSIDTHPSTAVSRLPTRAMVGR